MVFLYSSMMTLKLMNIECLGHVDWHVVSDVSGEYLPSLLGSARPLTTREVKIIHIIRQCTLVWISVRRGSWPFSVIPFQKLLSGPYHSHFTGRFTRLQATFRAPKFKFSVSRGSRLLMWHIFPTIFKEIAGKF